MKQSEFPQWARKIKEESEGNVLRLKGDKIYLYKSTSRRIPEKKYPVATEEYLGVVTPNGLIPAESFQFYPLLTEVCSLEEAFPLVYSEEDITCIKEIVVVNKNGRWMLPKIEPVQEAILQKYLKIEKGEVICKDTR